MTDKPNALPVKPENIPAVLREIPRWICWAHEFKPERGGWAKIPKQINGRNAASDDPSTWSTFEQALAAYQRGGFDGIGIVIQGGDHLVGLDLDDCVDMLGMNDLASETVDAVAGYWETSPSGTGVKCLTRASIQRSRKDNAKGIEFYVKGRYFTVTGHVLRSDFGPDQTATLSSFLEAQFGQGAGAPASEPDGELDPGAREWLAHIERKPPVDGWPIERVQGELLPHLSADDYHEWIRVGQILHHQGGGDGDWLELWDEWSSTGAGYDDGVCEQRWESFNSQRSGDNAATLRSLIKETATARQEGERLKRVQHVGTLQAQVLACPDVEALKELVKTTLQTDKVIDESDRNGALTVSVQARFSALGSPQRRDDVRKMLRPPVTSVSSGGPAWLDHWAFVTNGDRYFNTKTKASVTAKGFDALNNRHMPLSTDEIHRESASDYAISVWSIPTVDNTVYAPGQPAIFEMIDKTWANEFNEASVPEAGPGGDDAIRMVQAHLRRLVPDQREREILLSWMAHNARHPGRKIRWSPYMFGPQGTGKTFIAELMSWILGPSNCRVLSGANLHGQFNGWAIGSALLTIEEVYQSGHVYETEEKLKALVTNDTVDVRRMRCDPFNAPNFTNYLLLSNHSDGLPVGEGDRRYFFIRSGITTEDAKALANEGYFDTLFDTCKSSVPGLRRWLTTEVELHPEFDANGRAPDTEAKRMVIEAGKSDADVLVEEMLAGRDAVTTAAIAARIEQSGLESLRTRAVNKIMDRMGWRYAKQMKVEGRTARVYVRAAAGPMSDTMIKERLASQKVDGFDD